MNSIFAKIIEIRDDNNEFYLSFEATKNGIKKLSLEYNMRLLKFQKVLEDKSKVSEKIIKDFIIYNEMLYDVIEKYNLRYLIVDDNDENIIKTFFEKVSAINKYFIREQFSLDSNIKFTAIISEAILQSDKFSSCSYYRLVDAISPEFYDYKSLKVFGLTLKEEKVRALDDEDVDEEEDEEETIYQFLNDEIEGDTETEKNMDDYDSEIIFDYPVHKAMLPELLNLILLTSDHQEIIQFSICWNLYKEYLECDDFTDEDAKVMDNIDKVLKIKEDYLRKTCSSYDIEYEYYKDNIDTRFVTEESMFNTTEIFIHEVLDDFLVKKDVRFFYDLKQLFNTYDLDDKESCMYLVKDFSNILERYKKEKEIRCLKHIVTESNVKYFAEFLNAYYKCLVCNEGNRSIFGKNFTIDISDKGRNNG